MNRHQEAPPDAPAELENQFILRLPPEAARALRETIRSGAMNLKDRLSVRMEPDMRFGEVRLDHWLLHAKLLDLPSVAEALKTIDNKSFYKTADICQILICTEEEEPMAPEDDPPKQRKKDPNKVDKKYLWPHGIAPPLKNVRRRRFRKTLKKKYVEAPEIEKEVKRLLRVDNDAVAVKWEVLSEDALAGPSGGGDGAAGAGNEEGRDRTKSKAERSKGRHRGSSSSVQPPETADSSLLDTSNQQSVDVAEHEIFGEAVSDSDIDDDSNSEDDDEEEHRINVLTLEDEEESSRLMMSAGEDSRLSADNSSPSVTRRSGSLVTQFSREMFVSPKMADSLSSSPVEQARYQPEREAGRERLAAVERELAELRARREQREQQETAGDIENVALRQRFSEMLDDMIAGKEQELEQLYDQLA